MAKRKKTNEQTTITIADIGFPVYVPLFTCSQSFFFFLPYFAFQSFDNERTWWRLLQKRAACTKLSTFVLTFVGGLWKEILNSNGQQFHQYQQNEQSPLNANIYATKRICIVICCKQRHSLQYINYLRTKESDKWSISDNNR
jgi:hypothetical protein